jgi:hypothetical protein
MLHGVSQVLFLVVGALILLGSGFGLIWLIPPLRRSLTTIESTIAALLISSGITGIWAFIGRHTGMRLRGWGIVLLLVSAGLLVAGAMARRAARATARTKAQPAARAATRPENERENEREHDAEPEPAGYRRFVLSLAALGFILMLFQGGSLSPVQDSLDFVSFVRESIETGDLAPASPIYHAPPGIPPDPRRGSFHTQVAAICDLARTSPTDGWKWLPRLITPIAIIGLAAMLRMWIGTRAAMLATLLFVATKFFTSEHFLQNYYASRFGWIAGWGALLLFGKALVRRSREDGPAPAAGRSRVILLAIAAASPALLLSVHLMTGFQVLLSLGCAGLAVLFDRASVREDRRAVALLAIGSVALLIPALLIRLAGTPRGEIAANPLFDHLYGVMLLAPGWPIYPPTDLLMRAGISGIAAMILGIGLVASARRSRAAGFLGWSTVVPIVILFFPPLTRIIVGAHAHSVFARVLLTIPFAGILAWCSLIAVDRIRRGGPARWAGFAVLLLVALGLAGQGVTTAAAWRPGRGDGSGGDQPLLAAYTFLEERFPRTETILSDPITSYSIPAYTRHEAVSPFEQHSSPSDPTVDDRIRDVQEALNGRIGLARTFEVLRRYHVGLILLNQSFPRYTAGYYVFISPIAYGEQSAKFENAPAYFEKVYDAQKIRIYRVHDPGPGVPLPGDPPNADRIPDTGEPPLLRLGPLDLISASWGPEAHPRGKQFPMELRWRSTGPPTDLPVICEMKFRLRDLPGGARRDLIGRTISALFVPTLDLEVLRFGFAYRPIEAFFPDFLWKPGEAYRDSCWISVPPRARDGIYDVYFRLRTQSIAPVLVLNETLRSDFGKDWTRVGELCIGK